ncbi:MAG: UDP-3-O-(3-hydroxymyristoyl)glucosamine N-acyltransferase [Bacteroidetes bacterium]|nr:MAG: UDP-3-O-(3-hydroxymyristoyl)glucosamine N-acyltransferase [Bacteroidota bacterium]TNE99038.1 MAG: UDP-3-O-(3-hydroxymyristoyl)glucosamine N-acyltransferase [Bacteroidota bacterium]
MKFSASQIAGILGGQVEGNSDVEVHGLAKIEEGKPGELSFLSNPKYEEYIYTTGSSICIVNNDFKPSADLPATLTLIRVENAYACFAKLLEFYDQMKRPQPGVEEPSFISPEANVGEGCFIGAFSYISKGAKIGNNVVIYSGVHIGENVTVGDNTIFHPNAVVYRDCVIGNGCTIHSGAVIGADGFGFAPDENGVFQRIPQIGNVILEDNVDIGANTTVDRATMGSTVIRKGTKLDNLVQIGHNVELGQNTALAAQAGIAGSTKVGSNVMIGGQVGLAGHIKIGDRVMIAAQSGVGGNVEDGKIIMGSPAFDNKEYKKSYIGFRKLPEIMDRLKAIEKNIKNQANEE